MAHPARDARLEELLGPVVASEDLELDAVVRAHSGGTPLVRVTVDTPLVEGAGEQARVDSDTLAVVSRAVSAALDRADPIDGEYLLEVSTPGAERELTEPRHWKRQVGLPVRVKLRDGGHVSGRVRGADDVSATLETDGGTTTIEYANMKKARARVELGSKD